MLVEYIANFKGLFEGDVASKYIYFGMDYMIIFQGMKIHVTMQLKEKHSQFITGSH
jgi:hypothetical protein